MGTPSPLPFSASCGRRQKNQREAAHLVLDPAKLLQSELGAIKIQRRIEIADANHGVQIAHCECPHALSDRTLFACAAPLRNCSTLR